MKRTILIFILLSVVAAITIGCGKGGNRTEAVKVENPPAQKNDESKNAKLPEELGGKPAAKEETKSAPASAKPIGNGWYKTESGLEYKDIKKGKGTEAVSGSSITVNYKGWLDNGTVFDSSTKPGREPFSFMLGEGSVIAGWEEGVKGMKVGGTRELKIPPALGYGSQDMGTIPPNSTLHFKIDLLEVE